MIDALVDGNKVVQVSDDIQRIQKGHQPLI